MIQITITKTEKNPAYNKKSTMYKDCNTPEYSTLNVLFVEITEKQFEAIRKAVLEVF